MTDLKIGQELFVKKFFWIDDEKFIGFTKDARHGQDLSVSGSVKTGDKLKVLDFDISADGDYVIVQVSKDYLPYGAQSADGAVFGISIDKLVEVSCDSINEIPIGSSFAEKWKTQLIDNLKSNS